MESTPNASDAVITEGRGRWVAAPTNAPATSAVVGPETSGSTSRYCAPAAMPSRSVRPSPVWPARCMSCGSGAIIEKSRPTPASDGSSEPHTLVEVHAGPGVMHAKFLELVETLRSEVLVFDRQTSAEATGEDEVSVEGPSLRRGVRWFGIYEQASLEIPGRLPHVQRLVAAGEQARVTRRLPMKLAIFDRQAALLPLTTSDEKRTASVVVVHPSGLLDALITLFDAYWARSTPLRLAAAPGDEPAVDAEVLSALAAGFKDEVIARQLGVSIRTARRRITRLLDGLGVATRFQAGAEAARRGLL